MSFDDVYATERMPMLRLAYLVVGSTELAEDIVQECFTELYRRWDDVDSPGAYVRRSVINRCLSTKRRRNREQQLTSTLRLVDQPPPDEPLWTLLLGLTPRQRAALVCTFYLDMTSDEAAVELGCSPATVRSLTKRAMAAIRKDFR